MAPPGSRPTPNPYGGFLNAERRAFVAGLEEEKQVILDSIDQYNKEVNNLLNSGDSKKDLQSLKIQQKMHLKHLLILQNN